MFISQFVLVVALYVGVAYSWDFAVSSGDQLIFYTNNGTETDRVHIQSRNLGGLAYDVVHNRILYIDKQNNNDTICGYNLSSKENECFIGRSGRNILSIAYDPVTKKLFFTDANEKSINWISLKRGYENNFYGNLLIKMDDRTPDDIAVDSCGGYIYWSNTGHTDTIKDTERARFSGSGREALYIDYDSYDVCSLTIDPLTQEIYYLDTNGGTKSMNVADLDGRNAVITFVKNWFIAKELTVSKDYVYFMTSGGESYKSVWRVSKKGKGQVDPEQIVKIYTDGSLGLAANYKIDEQINGRQDCDSLSNLITTIPEAAGTTCERCDVCVNYCVQGNCSVNDEGLPKCRCNVGYSGERCEIFACYGYCLNDGECSLNETSVPVCQCKGDYSGDRCHVNDCLNYCFEGNCSLSDEGHPICSCNVGYTGERCEVSACHGFCLNDGECFLNEEDEPICQCAGNHEGTRCEAHVTDTIPTYDLAKRNLTIADLLSIWGKRSSRAFVTFEIQP